MLNKLTSMERMHGDLFRKFTLQRLFLDEVVADGSVYTLTLDSGDVGPRSAELSDVVKDAVCSNDVAVVGDVLSANSALTEDGTFLFSDYDVRLTDVIVKAPGMDVLSGGRIVVSRPGGKLEVQGRRVTVLVSTLPLLTVGETYVFLAHYFAPTKSLFTDQSSHAWMIHDGSVTALDRDTDASSRESRGVVLGHVRDLVVSSAARCRKG